MTTSVLGHNCPSQPLDKIRAGQGTRETLEEIKNPDGSSVCIDCTNSNIYGDFEYIYKPAPGQGGKRVLIGRCVFVGGVNNIDCIGDGAGNPRFYKHTVDDGGDDDRNTWDRLETIWDVVAKRLYQICWRNFRIVGQPTCRPESQLPAHALNNSNAAQDYLASIGLWPPRPLPAAYSSSTGLRSEFANGLNIVRFETGPVGPLWRTTYYITLQGVKKADLVEVNPRFMPEDGLNGLVLTLNVNERAFQPYSGELLGVFRPLDATVRYTISDPRAFDYYQGLTSAINSGVPLEDIAMPGEILGIMDHPGAGGAMGVINFAAGITMPRVDLHPLDYSQPFGVITIDEITAAGAAWRSGLPLQGKLVSINELTDGSRLWRENGIYELDGNQFVSFKATLSEPPCEGAVILTNQIVWDTPIRSWVQIDTWFCPDGRFIGIRTPLQ